MPRHLPAVIALALLGCGGLVADGAGAGDAAVDATVTGVDARDGSSPADAKTIVAFPFDAAGAPSNNDPLCPASYASALTSECRNLGLRCSFAEGACRCGSRCACVPRDCSQLPGQCGPFADGCGGCLDCGVCPSRWSCAPAGVDAGPCGP